MVQRLGRMRLLAVALVVALGLAPALGCASARVWRTQRHVAESQFSPPSVVLIHNLTVRPSNVQVDGLPFSGGAPAAEQLELGRKVADSLSRQLVEKLTERGIHAARATSSTTPPLNAIVLKGHFVSIHEGSRMKRVVVGFGAGASKIRAELQVYQQTEIGLRRLVEGEAEAKGSKKPGMAVPVGVGAAAGRAATSAAISGGITVATELAGGLEADAGRIAEKLAERAEALYRRRGWL